MFKSQLPINCPPKDVEEQEIDLYRLVVPGNMVESFKNYNELEPENEKYKFICNAYGISFFDNIESVKDLLTKERNEGMAIAKIKITKNFGVLTKRRTLKGHYTLWLYQNFNPNVVNCEIIS